MLGALLLLGALAIACGQSAVPTTEAGADGAEAGLMSASGSRPPVLEGEPGGTAGELRMPAGIALSGSAEMPGPGHPTGVGSAALVLVAERNEVCMQITVRGLDQPTAAHLHEAGVGEAGDVVLALPAPPDGEGSVDACVSADAAVIDRLRRDPVEFYVNIHSASFPDGALRGQLR